MEDPSLSGVEDKLAYFQAVTGLEDHDLCTEILSAHGWNLDLAVSSVTSPASPPPPQPSPSPSSSLSPSPSSSPSPSLAWKLVTLPFHVVTGGFGLAYAAFGLGAWVVGGVLSRSLGLVGSLLPPHPPTGPNDEADRLVTTLPPAAAEASSFVEVFDREYGVGRRPNFVAEGFMEALQRSRREFKLLFVYLHSPDHSDTPRFCSDCLCADIITDFVNENFVAWGGSIRGPEGFKMSNSLKASRFPFCAVVMASANQRIALLQQIEGPKSPDEMLSILQQVLEEVRPSLVEARVGAEERMHSIRLREEQDAAYRAALEADQARERQKKEEQERLEREAAEAERKRKEEEEARKRAAREAAEKEATIARRRQEKAMSLGVEPPKGPDVTQVVVRFPTGERKERRFHSSSPVKSIYDFVDSLECLKAEKYILVSNFPRTAYGLEMHSQSLREAGLHPNAMLFFEEAS